MNTPYPVGYLEIVKYVPGYVRRMIIVGAGYSEDILAQLFHKRGVVEVVGIEWRTGRTSGTRGTLRTLWTPERCAGNTGWHRLTRTDRWDRRTGRFRRTLTGRWPHGRAGSALTAV